MKKIIFYLLFIFFNSGAFGQPPAGNLYYTSYPDYQTGATFGILGYISYPSNQYHFIDSTSARDIAILGTKLFTIDTSVNVYDLQTNQLLSSYPNIKGHLVGAYDGLLFVGDYQPPHINVYDINNNLAPVFSLDTPKVIDSPIDITFSNDKAYLTGYNESYVIDIILQDTACILRDTNSFTYYQACENNSDYVYLLSAWPTGAPHEGISRLDKLTKQVDVLVPVSFKPTIGNGLVIADDKIYAWWYPTYYDLSNDSLHIDYYMQTAEEALAFDSTSNSVFTMKGLFQNATQIRYYKNNLLIDSININNQIINTVWIPGIGTAIPEMQLNPFLIYPNPVSDFLYVESTVERHIKQINLVDINGKIIEKIPGLKNKKKFEILISHLNEGVYYLDIISGNQHYTYPLIKE